MVQFSAKMVIESNKGEVGDTGDTSPGPTGDGDSAGPCTEAFRCRADYHSEWTVRLHSSSSRRSHSPRSQWGWRASPCPHTQATRQERKCYRAISNEPGQASTGQSSRRGRSDLWKEKKRTSRRQRPMGRVVM